MLTEKQKESLLSFNKKQSKLIRRFEELAAQLGKAGVGIAIDEAYNDIYFINEKPLMDGITSSYENIRENFPDIPEKEIESIDYLVRADITAHMIYDGKPYGVFRRGSVKRIKKQI